MVGSLGERPLHYDNTGIIDIKIIQQSGCSLAARLGAIRQAHDFIGKCKGVFDFRDQKMVEMTWKKAVKDCRR